MAFWQQRNSIVAIIILTSLTATTKAAEYPASSIRLIVPFPPGGSSDLTARVFMTHLSERLKQTIVIENRPGGDGMLGPTAVARSRPDGYTLLLGAPTLATVRATMKTLPIDPIKDLDAVSQLVESPYVVAVNASLPVTDLKSFVAYTKANPGKLNYGSWSTGGQLTYGFFKQLTGADLTHVGYKGEAITMAAVGANEVQAAFGTSVNVIAGIKSGTMRALAVTGNKRLSSLPEVPTTEEAGVRGFVATIWFGVFAPAGTPEDIKTMLSTELLKIAKLDDVISRLGVAGLITKASTPTEFAKFVSAEEKQWLDIARLVGITPQ